VFHLTVKYQGHLSAYVPKYILSFYTIALSLIILHILFALLPPRFAKYILNLLLPLHPLISLPSLLPLGYLSDIHNTSLQFPEESVHNKRNEYLAIWLRTFPFLLSVPNSRSATLFPANLGITSQCYFTKPTANFLSLFPSSF
jgi:hypothetical protein